MTHFGPFSRRAMLTLFFIYIIIIEIGLIFMPPDGAQEVTHIAAFFEVKRA